MFIKFFDECIISKRMKNVKNWLQFITFLLAVVSKISAICEPFKNGNFCSTKAATPLTSGVEKLVPEAIAVAE